MKDNIDKYWEIWKHENLLEHTGMYWEGIVEIWGALFGNISGNYLDHMETMETYWEHVRKILKAYSEHMGK